MTTTNTTTEAATTAATDAPAASSNSQVSKDAPPAGGSGEPSSTVPAATQGAAPASAEPAQILGDDSAAGSTQGDGKADADKSKPDGQASDAEKPKDGEGKEGEDAEQKPIEYQLTAPEGMEMDADALAVATPIFQEMKATNEQAQALTNIAAGMVSKVMKANADAHNKQVQDWHDATVKEFGAKGKEDFDQKVGIAQKALNKFMSPEERQMIRHYGFGNFPALFRMAHAIGLTMKEDTITTQGNQGDGKEETLGQTWYGNNEAT